MATTFQPIPTITDHPIALLVIVAEAKQTAHQHTVAEAKQKTHLPVCKCTFPHFHWSDRSCSKTFRHKDSCKSSTNQLCLFKAQEQCKKHIISLQPFLRDTCVRQVGHRCQPSCSAVAWS